MFSLDFALFILLSAIFFLFYPKIFPTAIDTLLKNQDPVSRFYRKVYSNAWIVAVIFLLLITTSRLSGSRTFSWPFVILTDIGVFLFILHCLWIRKQVKTHSIKA